MDRGGAAPDSARPCGQEWPFDWEDPWGRPEQRDVDPVVEVAGIEPASDDENPGLLRVQCAKDFLGPRARAHTFSDRPSRVGCPAPPLGKAAQLSFLADARD